MGYVILLWHSLSLPYTYFPSSIVSRRDSPVRGQIYLLKIASIYGNFTPIGGGGGKMAIFGYFLKIESVQKVIDYKLKMKKPTDRRHMQLTFYRSKYFKMPSFLSYNSSKDLVPNQGSVEILDPDRGHIMLSFPYKFLLTSIKKIKR